MYLSLLLLACGHSSDDSAKPVDADTADTDTATDSAGESSGDTSPDSSADTSGDTAEDTSADSAVDTAADTSADSAVDTAADTSGDSEAVFDGLTVLATFDGEDDRDWPHSIAVGDLTGDGVPDVALAGDNDSSSSTSAGWVTLWPGPLADASRSSPGVLDIPGTVAGGWVSPDGLFGSYEGSDSFGSSLVVGDLNGDGLDDMGVGGQALTADGSALAGGGAAYVFAGPLTAATTSRTPTATWTGDDPEAGRRVGYSLNLARGWGPALLLNLDPDSSATPRVLGYDGDLVGDHLLSEGHAWDLTADGDVGTLTALGDLDGDGVDDLGMGGWHNADPGRLWVVPGPLSDLPTSLGDSPFVSGISSGSLLLASPCPDLDGDGRLDLLVAERDYTSGTGRIGRFDHGIDSDASLADAPFLADPGGEVYSTLPLPDPWATGEPGIALANPAGIYLLSAAPGSWSPADARASALSTRSSASFAVALGILPGAGADGRDVLLAGAGPGIWALVTEP